MSAESSENRSGLDARQRGWFWHWNGIVTQYAPLIGLKGVGLLNSYTVWTDRREESPHRGYAFPSQQAEADFYGEERAELITINKILVALGLIEIRKEMILRTDERGRGWRVPHNLYRVRDRPDGVTLRADDVLRVAELAAKDDAVFRHVRRVFSGRFKPIDRDNVWHDILVELANHPLWQELQERTREIEERASARTRAGHRRRAPRNNDGSASPEAATEIADTAELRHGERPALAGSTTRTSVAESNNDQEAGTACVATTNTGSGVDVAAGNDGSDVLDRSIAAGSNNGRDVDVEPSNSTYDQEILTTTTTTSSGHVTRDSREGATGDDMPRASAGEHDRIATSSPRSPRSPQDGSVDDGQSLEELAESGDLNRTSVRRIGADREDGNGDRDEEPGWGGQRASAAGRDGSDERGRAGIVRVAIATDARLERGQPVEELAKERCLSGNAALSLGEPESGRPRGERPRGETAGGEHGQRGLAGAAPAPGPGAGHGAAGPVVDPSPLVVSVFEAANNRRSTPLERILLGELERDADAAARATGSSGAEWLAAAMREAVASGSTFVAPKRIREIVNRWAGERDRPERGASSPSATDAAPGTAAAVSVTSGPSAELDVVAVRLPGGARGTTVWPAVLDELSRVLDRDAFDRLLSGSVITRYWRGTVEIRVASASAAGKLSTEYRSLVERYLNARLKRPVSVSFHAAPDEPATPAVSSAASSALSNTEAPVDGGVIVVSAADVDLGRQLWHAILDDLAAATDPDDQDRLAPVVPLGQDNSGAMVLGVSSPIARRLIEGRYRSRIERSLSGLLGGTVTLRTVLDDAWTIRD